MEEEESFCVYVPQLVPTAGIFGGGGLFGYLEPLRELVLLLERGISVREKFTQTLKEYPILISTCFGGGFFNPELNR